MKTERHQLLTRRNVLLTSLGMAATVMAGPLAAQAPWPQKPLRMVVPYPAGGVNDVVARMLSNALAESLGQPVVVENKPGAGGTIGMADLAKSDDQHTFGFAAISPLTLNPYLMNVAYNPLEDILPVASVMYAPVYVMATSAFQGHSFADLLAQAKTSKGVTVATSGYGTLAHIMVEQMIRTSGANFIHVPYKGGSQLITDAAGAQFDVLLANPFAPVNALIEQGKLRLLATTGPQRPAAFPQVATLGELGFNKANLTSMFGFYTAKGTSSAAIQRFNQEVNRLLGSPAVQQKLRQLDNTPQAMTPEQFSTLVRKEYALNGVVIEQAGIKAQ